MKESMSSPSSTLLLTCCAAIYDPVTTTDELIPSGETSSYRSNPLKLAEFTLSRKDPQYVSRAKAIQAEELKRRREAIKAKVAVARTQGKLNEIGAASDKAEDAMSAFQRMEEKADRMLDREAALAELNAKPVDEAAELEAKYGSAAPAAVDDELARMKAELGL